ncbi:OsmC family protein [Ruania alkalisoli]|uniref:OsmC family protein n=1 Tax=Ruania alkalisoli TaxID=2779775 RepID=A0A7M1SWF0_9MICO|nr:OsmC family protein [Ruania alkalisoli]QOR71811.1 OsmC family protein [Ruania alkalisoli]
MELPTSGLRIERTGTRQYVARNDRGGEVAIGPREIDGVFNPGELMALALAACTMMSADLPIGRRLGEDFTGGAVVSTEKDEQQNRYTSAEVDVLLDTESLSEREKEALVRVISRAAEQACTVGRTLAAGLPHGVHLAESERP